MTQTDIARCRLASQQLLTTNYKTAPDMVAYMAAVQGQEYGPAKWGLGLRLPHLDEQAIEKDLTDGKILRTHLLRPTWHLVAAQDIRWLLMLTGPRIMALNQSYYKKANLTAADFKKSYDILTKMLEGGKQRTREEIKAELARHQFPADSTRMICLMMQAELDGLICIGSWKRTIKPKHIEVTSRFLQPPGSKQQKAFDQCLARYETFHGLPLQTKML